MVFYTEGPFSKQASFVFPPRANWLALPLAAVVSSAELGLRRERKLSSGSVQRLPGSGWSSAEVLNAPSKGFFFEASNLRSGQRPTVQKLLHALELQQETYIRNLSTH